MAPDSKTKLSGWVSNIINGLIIILTSVTGWIALNIMEVKTQQAVMATKIEQAIAIDKKVEDLEKKFNEINILLNRLMVQNDGNNK